MSSTRERRLSSVLVIVACMMSQGGCSHSSSQGMRPVVVSEETTVSGRNTLPIWELSASSDSETHWREMRIQRQGDQELINFRSVPKSSRGGWLYGIYLYGPKELAAFTQVLEKYRAFVLRLKSEPLALGKQKLGETTQHKFWLDFDGGEPVLEFSDPKNFRLSGMSMLGQDTIEEFLKLSKEYKLLAGLLGQIREVQKNP